MKRLEQLEKLSLKKKILVIICMIIFIAICNFFFYNFKSLSIPKKDRVYNIDFSKINYETIGAEQEKTVSKITMDLQNKYVRYLVLHTSKLNFDITLNAEIKTKYGTEESLVQTDSIEDNIKLRTIVYNINSHVSKLSIDISNMEDYAVNQEVIGITIDNSLYFNWVTFGFWTIVMVTILIILFFTNSLFRNIHILTFLLCISIGTIFIFSAHNIPSIAYDGAHHFRIYNYFTGNLSLADYYNENNIINFRLLDTKIEKEEYNKMMNQESKNIIQTRSSQLRLLDFGNILKWPEAMVLKLTRTLNINYTTCIIIARIVSLLIYSVVVMFAVKIMPNHKLLAMLICIVPTNLFLATNFTRDVTVTAFLFLSFALFANEYYNKKQKLKKKNILLCILSGILASSTKCIYAPILLLLLLLPKDKFDNEKQCYKFRLLVIAVTIVVFSSYFLEMFALPEIDLASDTRGGSVSIVNQTVSIIKHPIIFINMFIKEVITNILGMFFTPNTICLLSYYTYMENGTYSLFDDGTYSVLIVCILLAFLSEKKIQNFSKNHRVKMLLIYLFIICCICGSMYLVYTPVGSNAINGVQNRYFIPLLIPIIYCFSSSKLTINLPAKTTMVICSIFSFLTVCFIIYKYIILIYCL